LRIKEQKTRLHEHKDGDDDNNEEKDDDDDDNDDDTEMHIQNT
jgi:hypothetical protein